MPCHPDCEIGHDPPRAVLRQDDDVGTWRPILRFQPPGDRPHFLDGAAPGPLGHLAMNRLGQERLSLQIMFKRINSLQRQLASTWTLDVATGAVTSYGDMLRSIGVSDTEPGREPLFRQNAPGRSRA